MKTCNDCAWLKGRLFGRGFVGHVCGNAEAHAILKRKDRHVSDKACSHFCGKQAFAGRIEAQKGRED